MKDPRYQGLSGPEGVKLAVASHLRIPFEVAELQLLDAAQAVDSGRFGLFYDVGVGKTVASTIAATVMNADHNLVVCPPILLNQWEEWLNEIGLEDTSIYRGPKRTVDMLDHHWVIMSHAIWRDSFDTIRKFYADRDALPIVDEAQALKNPASKLFKSVNQFIIPDRKILLLTATPTSKPEDSYAYVKLKDPSTYRSFGHWQNMHVDKTDIYGNILSYKNIPELAEAFNNRTVRRTKQEMFGAVVEPIYQRMPYELSKAHYKLYERLAEEQLLLLDNGEKIDATTAQRLRHALQQIVVNYSKYSGNPKDRSASYDIIDQVVDEVNPMLVTNSKLVIWTYYVATSESVTAYLREKLGARAVVAAYGKVNSQKAIDAIMNDPQVRVLVAQPSSCGAGLNLQKVSWENLFLEMATTPMQIRQAMGRTDRKGQLYRPTMRFAQALGTIQVKLFNDLLNNDDLVSQVERTPMSLREEIFGRG